jgi:UPF0271 protein
MHTIDLNCDCGESYGPWTIGDDAAILDHVTSANIACGGHAGDPLVMRRTVALACARGVAIGAHPGYPDLQGFGRRSLGLSPDEAYAWVLAQIGALAAIVRAEGAQLVHVKPHGALYNDAARDPVLAQAIARAVASFDPALTLVGLAGSQLIVAGQAAGLPVAREAFADRAYEADGSLRDRRLPGALIHDEQAALAQAISIARDGAVSAYSGEQVAVHAETLCLHGDAPGAAARAARLRSGLAEARIAVRALR